MNILNSVMVIANEAHSHGEEHGSVLKEAWELITDPAHAITEVFYSLLFDLLIIPITILIYRKVREPKLRKEIHAEIDLEHGIQHIECDGKQAGIAEPNEAHQRSH